MHAKHSDAPVPPPLTVADARLPQLFATRLRQDSDATALNELVDCRARAATYLTHWDLIPHLKPQHSNTASPQRNPPIPHGASHTMGDSYRPGGGGGSGNNDRNDRNRYQDSAYDRPRDRNYRQQQYDPYPPPPPPSYYDSRPPPGTSSYRPPGPPPSSYHEQSRNSSGGGFTFRGAASGGQSYRPEQNFTFDAPGPRAPNGFAPESARSTHDRPRRFDRDGGRPRHDGRGRGSNAPRGRGGYRGFGPKPAHDRAILNKLAGSRETTPEQFEGMDEGHSRFKDAAEVESSEGDDSDDDGPRKRTKVGASDASAAPKWSNPDPYTALPPPETLGAPKKDIVQVIRKAKNEAAPKTDKVADNADFISFNFDDEGDAEMDSPPPPPSKSPARTGEPTFSHRDSFHRKTSVAGAPETNSGSSNSFTPTNKRQQGISSPSSGPGYNSPQQSIVPEHVSRPPKRKARDIRQFGDVIEEWQSIEGQTVAPWSTINHSETADVGLRYVEHIPEEHLRHLRFSRLHKEICDFYEYVRPRDYEEAARLDLVSRVETAIRAWSGANGHAATADVHCFGSFASGLYLPTADMDLVVISKSFLNNGTRQIGQTQNQLRAITNHMEKLGIAKPHTATFIGRSKVPIVKFTDKRTGIKVDISFENDSGFPALEKFKAWKQQYPALPVLVALVKQVLVMRGINEVFCGGVGGFTTICLVMHILQTMPEIQSGSMDPSQHYGEIFMKFLDFYGNKIDIRSTGILMHSPYHYDKDKNPRTMQNKDRLTIIDPNNPDNDISGGSHKIDTVFGRFRSAYSDLQRYMATLSSGQISTASILECVIGGNYQSVDSQRDRLRRLYGNGTSATAPALAPAPVLPPGVQAAPRPAKSKPKPNKKAKKRAAEEASRQPAAAQSQYAPLAPPPMYVAQAGFGNVSCTSYPSAPSLYYPPCHPQQMYYQYPQNRHDTGFIPPPPPEEHEDDIPPPPPPLPPPMANAPPQSPDSSASMDMSD
jgi:non-canonical poly(A) RNA polymerase PAPD5/7